MPFLGKLPGVAPLELLDGSVTSQKIADLAIAAVDIADDAVTYSKIQNVSATDRLLGRDTAGAGVIEEITPAAIRTMINVEDGANNYTHPSNHSISFIDGLQSALNLKADDTAISNIDNTSDANKPVSTATLTALNLKANNTAISNIDNTSDLSKPVSTATQTALTAKADAASVYTFAVTTNAALAAKADASQVLTNVPSGAVFTDTNTTYTVGDGGLTQKNFTTALDTKLGTIEASADVTDTTNVVAALTAGTNVAIAANGTISSTDTNTVYTHPSDHSIGFIAGLQAALAAKADDTDISNIDNTSDLSKPISTDVQTALSLKTNSTRVLTDVPANAVFTDTNTTYVSGDFNHDSLTGFVSGEHIDWTGSSAGVIHLTNLPATALTSVQTAVNEIAMLALTTEEGDVVVRSDESKTYMHNGGVAGTIADFTLLSTPTDSVASVDGATGIITLNHDTLAGFVANEHVDWTTNQGATNINAGNYIDTVYTHPNHSGEVTSTADGATVIASNVVDEDNLKISNAGTNGQYLQKQSGNVGGLTWETVQGAYNAWAIKTTTYTAISGDQLIANHASTPFTISLPASPSIGDTVIIKNVGAALVTVAKVGAFTRINSVVEDATLPTGNAAQLVYVDSIIGWTTL